MALTFQDLLAAGWTQREAALLVRYRNAYALASSLEIARQRINLDHAEASRWCWVKWLIQRGLVQDKISLGQPS